MKKLIFLFLFICISIPAFSAQVTDNYELVIPGNKDLNWLPIISRDFISIDRIMFIISQDSVIVPIISSDVGDLKEEVGIISSDVGALKIEVGDLKIEVEIISDDVGLISGTVVIISNDAVDWVLLHTIMSSDVGRIDNTVTIISNDMTRTGGDTTQPAFQFTITDPENIPDNARGDQAAPIWVNDSGRTFTVSKIEAWSDEDNYAFHLGITSSLTDFSIANQTTMDVVSCDTDGTDIFTDTITSGFDDSTVGDNQMVLFQHFENSCDVVKVGVYGSF